MVDEVKTAGKEKDPWSDGDPWKRVGATSGKERTGRIGKGGADNFDIFEQKSR